MNLKLIKGLCSINIHQLRKILCKFLYGHGYKKITNTTEYIMAEGALPICLIAHMDTVFKTVPDKEDFFYDKTKKVLWSPNGSGFDDRAGIYSIIQILEAGFRPSIIFTNEEEVGGLGARALVADHPQCPFKDCRALIQLDRANEKDMVFYNCVNEDFADFIEKYDFELAWGSFSDISVIAPMWEIAAVNLSVGYVDEHTTSERLYCDWCDATIEKVKRIMADAEGMPSYSYLIGTPNQSYQRMFSINDKACIFCGRTLKNNLHIKDPLSSGWNYYCCPSCYKTYGLDDEDENKDKVAPF